MCFVFLIGIFLMFSGQFWIGLALIIISMCAQES